MRKGRSLLWQIYPSHLFITVVALVAVSLYAAGSLKTFFLHQTEEELAARAYILKPKVIPLLEENARATVDALARTTGRESGTRFTVVLTDGEVVGDTHEDPARMENHADRNEVETALSGNVGIQTRHSETLGQTMMYVAIPLERDGRSLGVLRASIPLDFIDLEIRDIRMRIFVCGFLVILLAALVSLLVSRWIARPIAELKAGADRFAGGDLDHRLFVPPVEEMGGLARSMNQMAEQLGDRIQTEVRQRNELEAVLSSMAEGVIAVDGDGRILRLNESAMGLFDGLGPGHQGANIRDVVRNVDVFRFLQRALEADGVTGTDIRLKPQDNRVLHGQSRPLLGSEGERIGTLLVIEDVTQSRQMEAMRRDFVANVSHEIRTPMTAITGFVETLQEGPELDPAEVRRMLSIIDRNARRLMLLIEDLLTLSSIEKKEGSAALEREGVALRDLLEACIQVCMVRAREREIALHLDCPETLLVEADGALLEHAVLNVVDNAVKYGAEGSEVGISATDRGREVEIRVTDRGVGIAREHLPRLFERFYRVDRGRTRKEGGTGLGLAIVKHVMKLHGGTVRVESTPGKGSTFILTFPVAE